MKDLMARWVFTVGILYLLPDGRSSGHIRLGIFGVRTQLSTSLHYDTVHQKCRPVKFHGDKEHFKATSLPDGQSGWLHLIISPPTHQPCTLMFHQTRRTTVITYFPCNACIIIMHFIYTQIQSTNSV